MASPASGGSKTPAGPMITFQNVKTGLFLRVRNSGPIMHQPVTTGSTFTVWFMF